MLGNDSRNALLLIGELYLLFVCCFAVISY